MNAWSLAVGNLAKVPKKPTTGHCLWCGKMVGKARNGVYKKYCNPTCCSRYHYLKGKNHA